MLVLTNAQIARMDAESGGYGLIQGGALVLNGDRIAWVGAELWIYLRNMARCIVTTWAGVW